MYIKVRKLGGKAEDDLSLSVSRKAKIQELRKMIFEELGVEEEKQRLFYKGKQLIDDHDLYEYGVQLNDVIQLMIKDIVISETNEDKGEENKKKEEIKVEEDAVSDYYKINERVDVRDVNGSWFEAKIDKIVKIQKDENDKPKEEPDLVFKCTTECLSNPVHLEVDFNHIRPRSFYTFNTKELNPGMTVLANYNIDEPKDRGYWYDFKIAYVFTKTMKGTLFFGRDKTPLEKVVVKFLDEVMRIEKPILLSEKTEEDKIKDLPLRKVPFNCTKCKDDPDKKCKECGCKICAGKNNVENILLCDECDLGFHIGCLNPPLLEIPTENEWYCPDCKTDENEIVKAGDKLKFSNKKSKMPSAKEESSRDWGRGMACVGRTKECTLVSKDHLGPVPGVEVGTCWKFRFQVSEAGIHRPLVAGIHGRESSFAYSLVLSGGYEDDVDNGDEFYYTGSGGRNLSGNKRVSEQSCDQTLTRMNKALAMNCNAKFNAKDGAEAKDWKAGKPVRVVRNFKGSKHSKYAPADGNRYDGIYKVVKYYPEKGKSGFIVWKYFLKRDDLTPAPWEKEGQEFDIIYPPGYLEAEEKKKQIKEGEKKGKNKRALIDNSNVENTPTKKKKSEPYTLSADIQDAIKQDITNEKLWEECTETLKDGKLKFTEKVEEIFMCICCQEVAYQPITTECKHNICKSCLSRSFSSKIYTCPYCRFELGEDYEMKINDDLNKALLALFPGYQLSR